MRVAGQAQGRCPGEGCGFEGSVRQVESHFRSCRAFAALPASAEMDPRAVYLAAHAVSVAPSKRRVSSATQAVAADVTHDAAEPAAPARGPVLAETWEWPAHAFAADTC